MTEKDFILPSYKLKNSSGKVGWKSPSNIALVKYWGKKENQIPANPSISFTLKEATTTTSVSYQRLPEPSDAFEFDFLFEGSPKESFKPKMVQFFERIHPYVPFLKAYHFTIESSNSFPHSSGIASSASSMSALALCFMELEQAANPDMSREFFDKKASFLARLGSGSACRSIAGPLVQWGSHKEIEGSSDLYGVAYPYMVHPIFQRYQDTILLVDKGQKQVSSTVGHKLMHGHAFAQERFSQAHRNLATLKEVFRTGDVNSFIELVESEALSLHAMMMTSVPYFVLMKPNTLEIIERIWAYRKTKESAICFTLDAGANVHVLYPEREKASVYRFIKEELLEFCEDGGHLCDEAGSGAVQC